MIKNAEEAREIISGFQKMEIDPNISVADGIEMAVQRGHQLGQAKGYLYALDGPEFKAKDAEIKHLAELHAEVSGRNVSLYLENLELKRKIQELTETGNNKQ